MTNSWYDVDNLFYSPVRNPYALDDFRRILNVHLLLYKQVVLMDAFFLNNLLLRELLVDSYDNPRRYHVLVKDGSITSARRDIAQSFVALDQHMRETSNYGHPQIRRIRNYAEFLDSISPKPQHTYVERQRLELMATVADHFLGEDAYITQTRSRTLARDVLDAVKRSAHGYEGNEPAEAASLGGRSWYYRIAEDVGRHDPSRAQKLRLFSSAVFHYSMSVVLDLSPAYPTPIAGLVLPMHQPSTTLGRGTGVYDYFEKTIGERINVGPAELASLRPEAIQEIRRGKAFERFLKDTHLAQTQSDPALATMRLEEAIRRYIIELRAFLGLELSGNRDSFNRKRTAYRWVLGAGLAGGIATGAAGLFIPSPAAQLPLSAIGVVWSLAGAAIPEWLNRRMKEQLSLSQETLLAGPPAGRKGLVEISGPTRSRRQ